MKLIGRLKKDVENATSKTEANEILMNAGVELTPDELEYVTGGTSVAHPTGSIGRLKSEIQYKCKCGTYFYPNSCHVIICPNCGNNDLNSIEIIPQASQNPNQEVYK